MLILTRKPGEEIRIGDSIRIAVVDVQGVNVRLGFVAPSEVSIWRAELVEDALSPPVRAQAP